MLSKFIKNNKNQAPKVCASENLPLEGGGSRWGVG